MRSPDLIFAVIWGIVGISSAVCTEVRQFTFRRELSSRFFQSDFAVLAQDDVYGVYCGCKYVWAT